MHSVDLMAVPHADLQQRLRCSLITAGESSRCISPARPLEQQKNGAPGYVASPSGGSEEPVGPCTCECVCWLSCV